MSANAEFTAHEARHAAESDHDGVTALIQDLVRIPTRGAVDSCEPLISSIEAWLGGHGVATRRLADGPNGAAIGLVCEIGAHPGPHYVLDACLDTAPFGNEQDWRHGPTSAVVDGGWLHGRGSADSKAAIAIFMHIAARLHDQADALQGRLTVLFDADEHTGGFGGIKRFVGETGAARIDGVMIGYPGIDTLVVGGRGFLRTTITVHGEAAHSGSRRDVGDRNAVAAAAHLTAILASRRAPGPVDGAFGLAPKLTVTGIRGGDGFSIVPDRCAIDVDIRLTNSFDADCARQLVLHLVDGFDRQRPSQARTSAVFHDSWPAYVTNGRSAVRRALAGAVDEHVPMPVVATVAGPSNIGNYLAELGVPATAGFGVRYEALHGTDERIDVSTIPWVQAAYHHAVLDLLSRPTGAGTP